MPLRNHIIKITKQILALLIVASFIPVINLLAVTTAGTNLSTTGTFSVSGTSTLATSAGRVGIGTTTPSEALSVLGKVYTTGGIKFSDGTLQTAAASGGLKSVQVFSASTTPTTTWTKPAGITKVIVEVGGGGGGGSGGQITSCYGSSGGAGGYASKLIDVSSISSATITVGGGGVGGAAGANGMGGATSTWADGTNTVGAGWGRGGTASCGGPGGTGGKAIGGDINAGGGEGGDGGGQFAGDGGASFFGGGGRASITSSGTGGAGNAFGAGGGGGGWSSGTGGAGATGIVIVWEYGS